MGGGEGFNPWMGHQPVEQDGQCINMAEATYILVVVMRQCQIEVQDPVFELYKISPALLKLRFFGVLESF